MAQRVLNLRDAVMRLLDSTANTPNAVTAVFVDGTLGPLPTHRARPPDSQVLNGGKLDSNAHFVTESDEAVLEPLSIDMTFLLATTTMTDKVLKAMSNPFAGDGTWQPDGATTWAPVTSIGSADNADGTSVSLPLPADKWRQQLCDVEIFATNPDGSGDDFGLKLQGVYFEQPKASFSNPTGTLETTLTVYGAVSDISSTGFTSPINAL